MRDAGAGATLPPLRCFLAEAAAPIDWLTGRLRAERIGARHRAALADGPPVMVIPGFLADDRWTRTLRSALDAAGRRSADWGLGQNRGATADLLERLGERIDALTPSPIALVGWSLGGVIAREVAKIMPGRIERVVTIGSPFSGDPRSNRAWRLYERVAGHAVDDPPLVIRTGDKPQVPTIAIWSPRDGVVAASSARGLAHESDLAIEIPCRHMGLVSAPRAIRAVLGALSVRIA